MSTVETVPATPSTPPVDERLLAMAQRIGEASALIELLEDELAATRARLLAPERREQRKVPPPRLAFNKAEAAVIVGVSVDFFDAHIAHELRCVRRGRRRLYPLREIERWLDAEAERVSYR
jgi:hypothetical protein